MTLVQKTTTILLLGFFAGILFVAIVPQRAKIEARNAQRKADILVLAEAIQEYNKDHPGKKIPENDAEFCEALVPHYIPVMPLDPGDPQSFFTDCQNYKTGYVIKNGVLSAPFAEIGAKIEISTQN
jgi:hypothetical protein